MVAVPIFLSLALAAAVAADVAPPQGTEDEDVGYNLLFQTAADEFSSRCVQLKTASIPAWAEGDLIIPSVGQFEMGDRSFVGFGDAFGKLHRFSLAGSQVCATYRHMATGFRNESVKADTIGPGLLFYETEPPRKCPLWNPVCNIAGPNDNTFVNTIRHGDRLLSLTDSPVMLAVDPVTLDIIGKQTWKDELTGKVDYTGSAHPMRHPASGQWLDFVAEGSLFSKDATVKLFSLSDESPEKREGFNSVKMDSAPYMHSFGITEHFIVLPRMPVEFDASNLLNVALGKRAMAELFQELPLTAEPSPKNGFYLVPLNGSAHLVRSLPADDKLFYTHVVNAYETRESVIIDIATSPRNAFSGDLTIKTATTKAKRDAGEAAPRFTIRRFTIPLQEGALVKSQALTDPRNSIDFTNINPKFQGRRHCLFWGVEWFTDFRAQASMAITRRDVCGEHPGSRKWSRKHWYPSEPTLVPKPGVQAAEDEGLLIFTALDGQRDATYLMVLDPRTMELISEVGPFPRIGFTTHGEFYPAQPPAVPARAAPSLGQAVESLIV
jgi:carlactone synthase/all-trans-10'-apo-beta-carotenal 13,14-cleaving dioxygenase